MSFFQRLVVIGSVTASLMFPSTVHGGATQEISFGQISNRTTAQALTFNLDQIVSYLQGSLDWWLRLAGPRILQNRELLKQLVAQELEIKASLAWTLHSRLVLLRSLKTHFPMQEPQ